MTAAESTPYYLCLVEDHLSAGAALSATLPACNRVIYTRSGEISINGKAIGPDQAYFSSGELTLTANGSEASLLRWELRKDGNPPRLSDNTLVASHDQICEALTAADIGEGWFMRCDSVAFPPGGCALTHTHRGPGIRYLLEGTIRIDTQGESTPIDVGAAWFEAGPDPVFAQADLDVPSRFVRVMVLPPELAGKSSITYVNDEDRDKPKSQQYTGYCEESLTLS